MNKIRLFKTLALLTVLGSASACNKGNISESGLDASDGTDALSQDAGIDAGSDHGQDAMHDAGFDAGTDDGFTGDYADEGLQDAGGDETGDTGGDEIGACSNLLIQTIDQATKIPPPSQSLPQAGEPFVIPQTSITMTRITDSSDSDDFASFYTNGYSRWSPANITGQYVNAFASNGGVAIYRLSDRAVVRTLSVGEPNELNWDSSGLAGTETTLYYRTGAELRKVEVLSGNDSLVHDFTNEYPQAQQVINGVEGAPSVDMRYWAFQVCQGMTGGGQCTGILDVIVYDKEQDTIIGRLSDVQSNFPTPNFVDISPSGSRIVVGTCAGDPPPFNGPYAWSLDFSSRVRLSTGCTHSGWAWGQDGQELYINDDPCGANNDEITFSCDYIIGVDINDPQGWENRMTILYHGDMGWGNGTHFGRIYQSSVRGWFFVSTYTSGIDNWATNQLFFVETKEHSQNPRLFRVGPTLNDYVDYWSEAFASLDFQAMHIYWGANWSGQDNLELYQAELCPQWWTE